MRDLWVETRIKKMAKEGRNSAEIARAVGKTTNYVRQAASRLGVPLQRKRRKISKVLSKQQFQALQHQVHNDPFYLAQKRVDELNITNVR
jgi:hypothetical protein